MSKKQKNLLRVFMCVHSVHNLQGFVLDSDISCKVSQNKKKFAKSPKKTITNLDAGVKWNFMCTMYCFLLSNSLEVSQKSLIKLK